MNLSLTDLIVEAMPFSKELIDWCSQHPEFKAGLKFSNPDSFIPLGQILTSRTANIPDDEVIGFYTYDINRQFFKQDFIVNVGSNNHKFVLYSKLPGKGYGKYVQHINQFFAKYGRNGDYAGTHHVGIEAIDALNNPELSARARRAINTAAQIRQLGRRKISQTELKDVMKKIKDAKRALAL